MINAELLASLVNREVGELLLARFGSLHELAKASIDDLLQIKGIGEQRACAIQCAFMLADRLTKESYGTSPCLDCPEAIAGLLREENRLYQVEHFQLILLNTRRRLIRVETISKGSLDTILVHPREVFKPAIARSASAIVLAHNHPSGDPSPSEADIKVTRNLIRSGELLKIEVLDHIILGIPSDDLPKGFVSLRELGYFYK